MPRIMTMNGHHQSVASAPLDLRTRNRERGSACERPRTPDSHVSARVNGDRLQSPTSTRKERHDNGTTRPAVELQGHHTGTYTDMCQDSLDTKHSSMLHSPLASPKSVSRLEADAVSRQASDVSSSRLPFRKRPFPTGSELPKRSLAPPDRRDSSSPPANTEVTQRQSPKVFKTDDHLDRYAPPRGPSEEAGERLDGYHIGLMPAFNHYWCQWPPLQVPCPMPVPYRAHQATHSSADVAFATRPDEDGDTPLHIAVVHGVDAVVHNLISILRLAGRDVDIHNNLRQTPLHLAVITQQPSLVYALLSAGADPGVTDRNGQTALHLCCEYDQRSCLSMVLSRASAGPCLEIRNYEGLCPLHLAVRGDHRDLAGMLLDAGADINAMDIKSGQTPLMHAVENNNADMVHFLIEKNCDVNSQSYSRNTALHIACGRGQVDTVRHLLKRGADSSLKNYHNDTPVMVAKNKKVTDVLRGKGFKQTRSQDQHCMLASPLSSSFRPRGSPSPNHSLGRSPSTTPHLTHHSAPQSPKPPPTPSPHSQTTEGLSGRQSPMDIQEREAQSVRQGFCNVNAVNIQLSQRGIPYGSVYQPPWFHEVPLGAVMLSESHCNFLPHQSIRPAYRMISDSRPTIDCSDHSNDSTMSLSSGDKCDS